jgi:hypothetical protein
MRAPPQSQMWRCVSKHERSKSHSLPVATALGGGGVAAPFEAPNDLTRAKIEEPAVNKLVAASGERSAKGPAPGRLDHQIAAFDAPTGGVNRGLGILSPGEKPERDLHVALGLHRAAHNAEGR